MILPWWIHADDSWWLFFLLLAWWWPPEQSVLSPFQGWRWGWLDGCFLGLLCPFWRREKHWPSSRHQGPLLFAMTSNDVCKWLSNLCQLLPCPWMHPTRAHGFMGVKSVQPTSNPTLHGQGEIFSPNFFPYLWGLRLLRDDLILILKSFNVKDQLCPRTCLCFLFIFYHPSPSLGCIEIVPMPVPLNLALFNTSLFSTPDPYWKRNLYLWYSLPNLLLTLKTYFLKMKRSHMTLWIMSFPFFIISLFSYLWPRTFPGYELWEHIFRKRGMM